ncbi:MAG: hypothetical protein V3571_09335 [Pseudodesulfovibrio sp.]
MDSIFDTDNLTTLHYNPSTGQENRLWIRYGDDTFEPVRRDGDLNRKYHSRTRPTDWWVTEKPRDWNRADHGFDVSLNHDFGEHDKPGRTGRGAPPRRDFLLRNEDMGTERQTKEYRFGREEGKPVLFSDKKAAAPAARRTTLAAGGDGYRRAEAERQAAKSPSQAAEDIKGWEREQGIDPNQGSGHERRPPSSSRDAAEMEHARKMQPVKEYIDWLREQRENPAWGKERTPVEKVQGVTEPLAESVIEALLEQGLIKDTNPIARSVGLGMKLGGPLFDVMLSPGDAW